MYLVLKKLNKSIVLVLMYQIYFSNQNKNKCIKLRYTQLKVIKLNDSHSIISLLFDLDIVPELVIKNYF